MMKNDLFRMARALVRQARLVRDAGANDLAQSLARRGLTMRALAFTIDQPQPALSLIPIRRR